MARFGFCGPSYTSQSVTADNQICLNWYPESIESGSGKSAIALYPCPGLKVFCQLPQTPVRGLFPFNGRAFAVAGSGFYEVFSNGTSIQRGNVSNDGNPASITSGPNQLFFISGGHGYVFTYATNAFAADPANLISNPVLCGYADGFFVVLQANSNVFQISGLLDATSWNLSNVAAPNTFADNVVSMIVDHREIWVWGQKASTVYYNSGDPLFPFVPIPGAFIEQGCAAIYSQVKLDNSVFWLGSDERGNGIAWRASGYVPTRVSNHAVEFAWQQYPTISDAVGYAYQDQGHAFWVLYFPTANHTWVYDSATQMWHERDFWFNGVSNAHRSQCHMFAFGNHYVGDNQSGNIYQMDILFFDNFGNPLRRVRRAPHISMEMEWTIHNELWVDMETGIGPIPPLLDGAGNPRDPNVSLRWSNDGGRTWSNQHDLGAGQAGQFRTRVHIHRLGRSRDRIYEISVSDPIPWRILDAYLDADPGYQPTERLATQLRKQA